MADYWKSQPKYYCSICKCYMADNKVTRDKHEGGKSHQTNVEQRLREIRIKSLQEERDKRLMDDCLKQMNRGASQSMASDTCAVGAAAASAAGAAISGCEPNTDASVVQHATISGYKRGDTAAAATPVGTDSASGCSLHDWKESKTADGRVYFWNVKTKETTWERPQPKPDAPSAQGNATAADAQPPPTQPPVKTTKIRVLGSGPPKPHGGLTASAPATAPAASASATTTIIGERALPAGAMKRFTDTPEAGEFKTKRPK